MRREDRQFQRRRAELVDELRRKGIGDETVLAAIGRVSRHLFLEPALHARAYRDEALPIGLGQTISQPFTVAFQTALLAPVSGERILEIGTGSGYQASVLCELGVRVFTIERHLPLYERARYLLGELGYRVVTRHGDGTQGWAAVAPFDGIIVTAAAKTVPQILLGQLRRPSDDRPGGRMVIPVGGSFGQTMTVLTCTGAESYHVRETETFSFVPLVST